MSHEGKDIAAGTFKTPASVLQALIQIGYKRLAIGQTVTISYRTIANPLIKPFNGQKGKVISIDEYGNPWVKFSEQAWEKAIQSTAQGNRSPYRDSARRKGINVRQRSLLLNVLDVAEYKNSLMSLGVTHP
jgi:hypothetical protein